MTTFGLVHGICGGAWCWEAVAPHLEAAGHDVVAVDLPREDPDAGATAYAQVTTDALADSGDDVVLVGWSLGGLTIPLVAAQRPVAELVFLGALIPAPGKSLVDQGFDFLVTDMAEWTEEHEDGSISITPEGVRQYVAQDLDAAAAADVAARLGRQFQTPFGEPCPLEVLPDVPCRYVVCTEDLIISPDWSQQVARERLGVDAIELPGSHSPMLSRPKELADLLLA
jgi:pimeloyl-ACP methyl ester carboxylesterase